MESFIYGQTHRTAQTLELGHAQWQGLINGTYSLDPPPKGKHLCMEMWAMRSHAPQAHMHTSSKREHSKKMIHNVTCVLGKKFCKKTSRGRRLFESSWVA